MGRLLRSPGEVETVTPLDIIFSCHVCSATFSEIYDGHHETVHGLSDGINPKDRIVTKLFLTQCCHVICSKHLENGAPPFHPDGTRPSAPCPVCIQEKGENQPRDLFSIRGFRKGEYDEALAHYWFITPPVQLDAAGGEMEALRFQYVNLIRFSRSVATDYMQIKEDLIDAQNQLRTVQNLSAEEHNKVRALEEENGRLRAAEAELLKLKEQMPAVRHHLKLVPKLIEQNDQMRQRLVTLGYEVQSEPLTYNNELNLPDDNIDAAMDFTYQPVRSPNRGISSRTAGRSTCTRNSGEDLVSPYLQPRPLKRPRVDSPLPENNTHAPPYSINAMLPPKKPMLRMKSVKNLFPAMRKKLSPGRSSPALNSNRTPEADIQIYGSGHGDIVNRPVERSNDDNRWKRHGIRGETFYMTGALPVNHPSSPNEPPLRSSKGAHDEQTDFTFRMSSPVKQPVNQPGNLPTKRSYIRLMDGLSRDTGLELGLQDPRDTAAILQQPSLRSRQMHNTHRSPVRRCQNEEAKHWSFGHAFLHQSPRGTPSSAYQHPDPLRSNPIGVGSRQPRDESLIEPTTPAPQRSQQPAPRGESVVSPFFTSSNRNSQVFSRAGVAERKNSSLHSDVYQYQRPKTTAPQVDWREPRSLNGLSFFDSPRNARIAHRLEPSACREPPQQQYPAHQSRNLNSQGFIKRPETGRLPFLNDATSSSSLVRPSYSRQMRETLPHSVPIPSFSHLSNLQATPLPSSMPSIVSSHRSPIRTSQSQRNRLLSTGVRSSQNSLSHIRGNTFALPSRNPFTDFGRRSVRR